MGNCWQQPGVNDERAKSIDEMDGCGGGKTPEGKPWTWLWGEINPQSQGRIKPLRA